MRSASLAAAGVLALTVAGLSGCGDGSTATTASAAPAGASSNERRLTRSESLRLVVWVKAFRRCMLDNGTYVGDVKENETHLSLPLRSDAVAAVVVPAMTECAENQGGPPKKTSLQYRNRAILLYLPKQCLLDAKVAAT